DEARVLPCNGKKQRGHDADRDEHENVRECEHHDQLEETGIVCRRSASARRRNTATPRMVGVSNGLPPITSRTRNHTATPAAPRRPAMMPSRYTSGGRAVSLSASPGADGGADAAEVLLDVADEDLLHGLLSGHRRYTLADA